MKLIILRGKTGSGKSTILNKLKRDLGFKAVEIDDIKRERYQTVSKCNPVVDFEQAGKKAKELLDEGFDVVVEEAFLNKQHIKFLKNGLRNIKKHQLLIVRLQVSLETALKRKAKLIDFKMIKLQHKRKVDAVKGELIFNTENVEVNQIVNKVRNYFKDRLIANKMNWLDRMNQIYQRTFSILKECLLFLC